MTRILLADDSPHAQRMGEQILSEEGFEVVTVSDGDSALLRLEDVDPDLVLADVIMPHRSGYEICQYVKLSPRHKHVRVILAAGVKDQLDEAEARRAQADGVVQKPFQASVLLGVVKPLVELAAKDARELGTHRPRDRPPGRASSPCRRRPVSGADRSGTRARGRHGGAGRLLPGIIEEITEKVLIALSTR